MELNASRIIPILSCLVLGEALSAGCLAFAPVPTASHCVNQSAEMEWADRPGLLARAKGLVQPYEPVLADPALATALRVEGPVKLNSRLGGLHFIEVFLWVPNDGKHSFILELNGREIDGPFQHLAGPVRLRPRRGLKPISLTGISDTTGELRVKTDSPEYYASAVRWTPLEEWESKLAPQWMERGRYWAATPVFGEGESGASRRQRYMQQIFSRLVHSKKPGVRQEAMLNLTRAMYWVAKENHEPLDIAMTDLLFRESLKVMPENPVLRQMITTACGAERMPKEPYCDTVKPVKWSVDMAPMPDDAPSWAVEQEKLKARMEAITRWWVDKRQQPNGELGGGWGDDVEIIRHWAPLALGLGSQAAERGVRRLAEGIWASGTLKNGYDARVSDVEHSSEPTTDTQPIAAALNPADAAAVARLRETSRCADYWIRKQPDGHYRFRSSWFNCGEADESPERAVDTHMNMRAMGPMLWYAFLTRDPHPVEVLKLWAASWVTAMRKTDHGKPAGLFPPVLRSADGEYLIGSKEWDKPQAEWDYFQWSGASQEAMTSLLLALHELTGDRKWLDAAGETFRIFENCLSVTRYCEQMRKAPEAFYEWRKRSGDSRYDTAFGYKPDPEPGEALAGMAELAKRTEAELSVNFEMLTSEVIWTDRVYYSLPTDYRQYLFGGEMPRGDRYPTFAVTWPASPARFARAVLSAGPRNVSLRAYNFESRPVEVPVRLWRLAPGTYEVRTGAESPVKLKVTKLPHQLSLMLPARREVAISVTRVED